MGISKGVTFYSYLSSPGLKASFAARGHDDVDVFEIRHANVGSMRRGSRELDAGSLWLEKFARLSMTASKAGRAVFRGHVEINPYTGHIADSNLGNMLATPSIIAPDHAVSYGFYDAGAGGTHRAYLYVTDSYENWMGNLMEVKPALRSKPFGTFVLPGSHDAGMFTGLTDEVLGALRPYLPYAPGLLPLVVDAGLRAAINAAYTQKDDIATQLRLGVRYFDFRPGHDVFNPRSALRHQHAVIPGYELERFLADVVDFLRSHEREIVVVNLKYDGFAEPSVMTPSMQEVERHIAAAIEGTSLQRGRGDDLALNAGHLLANGKRLIVLHDDRRVRDSYAEDVYKSGDPQRVLGQLADTVRGLDGRTDARWAVLQLQGTCARPDNVPSSSDAASPLLGSKPRFDHEIYPWLADEANLADQTQRTLIALLNDFADNALVSHAIALTRLRADR